MLELVYDSPPVCCSCCVPCHCVSHTMCQFSYIIVLLRARAAVHRIKCVTIILCASLEIGEGGEDGFKESTEGNSKRLDFHFPFLLIEKSFL